MTKLLDQVLAVVRDWSPADQDEVAPAILRLAGTEDDRAVVLSPDEWAAIATSEGEAARDEFATDEDASAIWAKHGL